jgi:hypothetical protein
MHYNHCHRATGHLQLNLLLLLLLLLLVVVVVVVVLYKLNPRLQKLIGLTCTHNVQNEQCFPGRDAIFSRRNQPTFWAYLPSYPENVRSIMLQTGGKFLSDHME